MKWTLLVVLIHSVVAHLEFLKPSVLQTKTSPDVQKKAALNIIRMYYTSVDVDVDPTMFSEEKDVFNLEMIKSNGHKYLMIRASSGVAAVWGFNYYLKQYCNSQIGWQVQNLAIYNMDDLPYVNETVVANDRFRYYQNVCTVSYSFVWWKEADWKTHIGWMALNGINLALAPYGQEEVWMSIYRELGMNEDEIEEHFTGPAFLAWLRMGNMRGFGGPLPASWHRISQNNQRAILGYMRDLGMIPVLPAFAGHVPPAFGRLFPNSSFLSVQKWMSFSDQYCCPLFINPEDPLFQLIGQKFIQKITEVYGTNHIYNADPFNEIKTNLWSTQFVQSVGKEIFSSMRRIDPNSVWLLQNWMFVNAPDLWPRERVKAFVHSVPIGRMLILDLQAEQWPQYNAYDMYFGQPFLWCMLHNFGGTLGMHGNMKAITVEVYRSREHENSTMVGIGLTPEGINQNYVMYDLMLESAWRKRPVADLETWLAQYAVRRYGCNETARAWRYLLRSVYNYRGYKSMHGQYVITVSPSLNIKPWAWYKSSDLIEAWKEFVQASYSCSGGFTYDLCDVTRQVLQYRAEQLYIKFVNYYEKDYMEMEYLERWAARKIMKQYLEAMEDMETVLQTNDKFLLQSWLAQARSLADPGEESLYELNARNQITLWGPNGEISDYACKQWAGMFEHYYIPRWRMFFEVAFQKPSSVTLNDDLVQKLIRDVIGETFLSATIVNPKRFADIRLVAKTMFRKWSMIPNVDDLPIDIIIDS